MPSKKATNLHVVDVKVVIVYNCWLIVGNGMLPVCQINSRNSDFHFYTALIACIV